MGHLHVKRPSAEVSKICEANRGAGSHVISAVGRRSRDAIWKHGQVIPMEPTGPIGRVENIEVRVGCYSYSYLPTGVVPVWFDC